jgi:hypothetical protein
MMARKRGMAKDTSHESDGEESVASDVESDDEISPRDDQARRRARDLPSAEPTTESSEVRVKGQNGVNEVVAPNSGNTRTSPRFHIGSTGALPGHGIGDERFLCRTVRTNNNKTSIQSSTTGRFISSRNLTVQAPGTALRSVATGRFIHGSTANMSDSPAIDRRVRQNDGVTTLSSRHIRCETCRGYVDDRWYPRCHTSANEVHITGTSTATRSTQDDGDESESTLEVEVITVGSNSMTPIPRHNSDDNSEAYSNATEREEDQIIYSMCYECNEKVLIQMKMNGTCHGRFFYCHRRQGHLVCAEVNPDKMIDGIAHT